MLSLQVMNKKAVRPKVNTANDTFGQNAISTVKAAKILKVSKSTVCRAAKAGNIGTHIGNVILFSQDDLAKLKTHISYEHVKRHRH